MTSDQLASVRASERGAEASVDLGPYVPQLVRRWPGTARWTELEGTLVSADISGFTKLSESLAAYGREGAEQLTDLLNDCFGGMIAEASAFGGDVVKFGGDALLVWFDGAGHATRACLAAMGMRASIDRPMFTRAGSRVSLRMSIGMHSGVFTFFLARGRHHELVVTGPAATQVVACESEADAGQIMVTPGTASRIDPSWLGRAGEHGRLLKRNIERCIVDLAEPPQTVIDLRDFVPTSQQRQIAAGAVGEHKQATVAFLKFTHTDDWMATDGPDRIADLIDEITAAVESATDTYATHWLATDIYADGGKYILAAGVPSAAGHDEERMLRSVRSILDSVTSTTLRAGVNRGQVFAGVLGSPRRRTYTVMGDAVNLAARLMQKAGPGELIASKATLDWATAEFAEQPLEPFLVKGKAHPILASVVGDVIGAKKAGRHNEHPLIGRESELQQLMMLTAAATEGHGATIVVNGEPGIGKSRLLAELRTQAADLVQVSAACDEYNAQNPYALVRTLLRQLSATPAECDPTDAGRELTAWVDKIVPSQRPWLPLLAVPFGANVPPTPESSSLAPEFRRDRLVRALGALIGAALPTPSLAVIEDVQWIDDASQDLLAPMLALSDQLPLVVCLAHTGSASPGWLASQQAINLGPLTGDATMALAGEVAGQHVLSETIMATLIERSGGNPLFLSDLVAAVAAGEETDALPESIEALVTSRIDRLDAGDRLLLREASVVGVMLEIELLAEALGADVVRRPDRWERLEPFLTWEGPGVVRFRHNMYHHVAYEGLSYRQRRNVHQAIGEVLERRTGGDAEHAGLLSLHFSRSLDVRRAYSYSVMAGRAAQRSYANAEAADFYQRALENGRSLADLAKQDLVEVAEALGDVREVSAEFDAAADAYADARRMLGTAKEVERAVEVRLLRKQGVLRDRKGRYSDALRWFSRGFREIDLADGEWVDGEAAQLHLAQGSAKYRQGRPREALQSVEQAASLAERTGDRAVLGRAYYFLVLLHTKLGTGNVDYRDRALPIFEELGDAYGFGALLNNLGVSAYSEGHWDEAAEYYRRGRDQQAKAGDVFGTAMTGLNLAEILSDQGHLEQARPGFVNAQQVCLRANHTAGLAYARMDLGRLEVRAGNIADGIALLDDAIGQFRDIRATAMELEARMRRAEAELYAERCNVALELLRETTTLMAGGAADPPTAAAVARLRAAALAGLGRTEEAQEAADVAVHASIDGRVAFEEGLARIVRARIGGPNADVDQAAGWEILHRLGVIAERPCP